MKIGFELEFNLLNPDYTIYNPLDSLIGYSMLSGLRSNTLTILEEIITSLQTSGIEVWHLHTELPHQLEISLSPGSPMESIDSLLYSMETIRTCFLRHNILVTFFPRPSLSPSGPQNGLHLHLSLSSQESPEYQEILQTIVHTALNKMKALSAIGMANTESYVRAKPDSAGAWIGYGTENRDLPIRKISESRYELRMLDCSSNFYLFVAVVLSMGLGCLDTLEDIGIDAAGEKDLTTTTGEKQQSESSTEQSTQDHLHPQSSPHPQSQQNKFQDCPLKAPTEGNANLRTYGITEKMPKSLQETIEAFNNDKEIESWIGRELHGQYVKIKGHEIDYARDMSDDERRLKFLQFF